MLPVAHLIPRLSVLKADGANFDKDVNLIISAEEQSGLWVVETKDSSAFVGSLSGETCTKRSLTLSKNGGSFRLRLSKKKVPRVSDRKSTISKLGEFVVRQNSHNF
jgi:hypothetical protein